MIQVLCEIFLSFDGSFTKCFWYFPEKKEEVEEAPAKLLDDLFCKTKATPCIYWLPLTDEQVCLDNPASILSKGLT